jgi:hypothetical protein
MAPNTVCHMLLVRFAKNHNRCPVKLRIGVFEVITISWFQLAKHDKLRLLETLYNVLY